MRSVSSFFRNAVKLSRLKVEIYSGIINSSTTEIYLQSWWLWMQARVIHRRSINVKLYMKRSLTWNVARFSSVSCVTAAITWKCVETRLTTLAWRVCWWSRAAGVPAIDWYLLQTPALSSKLAGCRRCCCKSMRQRDGRTPDRYTYTLLRIICLLVYHMLVI